MGKNVIVGPHKGGDGWQVKKAGNSKASAVTPTKKQAVDRGRELAKSEKSELIVQNKDGKIGQKDSHGNDPRNVKG